MVFAYSTIKLWFYTGLLYNRLDQARLARTEFFYTWLMLKSDLPLGHSETFSSEGFWKTLRPSDMFRDILLLEEGKALCWDHPVRALERLLLTEYRASTNETIGCWGHKVIVVKMLLLTEYRARGWAKISRQAQNLVNSKKSTILIWSSWYSSNLIYSWDDYLHQVS